MIVVAQAVATALDAECLAVFAQKRGFTRSHQVAVEAASWGGGQAASKKLREAGFLACGIGLPIAPVAGDVNGLRIGTPELVRWGVGEAGVPELARLMKRPPTPDAPDAVAPAVAALPPRSDKPHYLRQRCRLQQPRCTAGTTPGPRFIGRPSST